MYVYVIALAVAYNTREPRLLLCATDIEFSSQNYILLPVELVKLGIIMGWECKGNKEIWQ